MLTVYRSTTSINAQHWELHETEMITTADLVSWKPQIINYNRVDNLALKFTSQKNDATVNTEVATLGTW